MFFLLLILQRYKKKGEIKKSLTSGDGVMRDKAYDI